MLYKLSLRHGGKNMIKREEKTYEMLVTPLLFLYRSDIGKLVNNECLECPFNMSFREEIIDYCLNECPGGRRDMVWKDDYLG